MGVDSSLPPIDIRFLSGELESWNYEYFRGCDRGGD